MRFNYSRLAGLLFVPAFIFCGFVSATPVTGQANIAGNVTVTATAIQFQSTFSTTVGATETGDFAGVTGGTIQSLSGGPITGQLVTPITGFVSFTSGLATPVLFDLTFIAPGVGTLADCSSAALGSTCTPSGSPFTLIQLSSNTVVASLQFNGIAYMGTAATGSTPTISIFSTQTAINGTIPQIYSQLASGQPLTGITYSASFNAAPVPEPASYPLIGIGLCGVGILFRRRSLT